MGAGGDIGSEWGTGHCRAAQISQVKSMGVSGENVEHTQQKGCSEQVAHPGGRLGVQGNTGVACMQKGLAFNHEHPTLPMQGAAAVSVQWNMDWNKRAVGPGHTDTMPSPPNPCGSAEQRGT